MKKMLVLAVAALMAVGTSYAQKDVVKTAKEAFKKANNLSSWQAAEAVIIPAFADPETGNTAETYYIPAETAYKIYDDYLVAKQLGKQVPAKESAALLKNGYNYSLRALKADSLPDAKGKVKPKLSNKIYDKMMGHLNDYDIVAVEEYQANDFLGAYEMWDIFVDIVSNPVVRKKMSNIQVFNDSTLAQLRFNQAIAAVQGGNNELALRAFEKAIEMGTDKPETYEYAYSTAYQLRHNPDVTEEERQAYADKMMQIAKAGFDKFGSADPKFLQWVVNGYIENKEYDAASQMLTDAIAAEPDNATYYFSLGILNEAQDNRIAAKEAYLKATELDPEESATAFYFLGRMLAEDYDALDQATEGMSPAEYAKYNDETLVPLIRQAAEYLEKAFQYNNEFTDPLNLLKSIYYRLNDGPNFERIDNLLKTL